jgi:superfamily I DNA/RNA helicase/RecB family exonuclease
MTDAADTVGPMTTAAFRERPVPAPPPAPDAIQRAVLDLPDDASAVIVGAPGSGKTELAVALVVDRVLERGWRSDEVVVLSPTRRSATALRDGIGIRLGVPTRGPLARTATSLAFGILRERATRESSPQPRLLSGPEQDAILRDILAGHEADGRGPDWPAPLTPEVRRLRGFRSELRELLARATEQRLDPQRLAALGARAGHPEWVAAARLIDEYQAVVDAFRGGYVDATELLVAAAAEVASREAAPGLRLLVVDDAQEATPAALQLLTAFAQRGTAVIALGDPDVAVGTFRGAAVESLARLDGILGVGVERFVLPTVHRQRPELRAVTARLTGGIGAAGLGRQRAAGPAPVADPDPSAGPAVVRIEAPSRADELARVARRLREHRVLHGVAWERMAVVVRSGSLVEPVSRALAVAEVPTRAPRRRGLGDAAVARHLVRIAEVALHPERLDASTAVELLTGPFGGLDGVSLRRLRLALRQEELSGGGHRAGDELLREAIAEPGRLVTIDSAPARRAARLASTLARVRGRATDGTIEELLWEAWESSGLAAPWVRLAAGGGVLAEEADRNLDAAVAVFALARDFAEREPDARPDDFLDRLASAEIAADTLAAEGTAPAVLVGTPAAVIGVEVDVVAVVGLQEGVWPDLRVRGTLLHPADLADAARGVDAAGGDARRAVLDDELRLFALATSRAREQVILSSVANEEERPSPLLRLFSDVPVDDTRAGPLTLRGLVGELRRDLATRPSVEAAAALARLAAEGVPGADPDDWYGLLEPSTSDPLVDLADEGATVVVSPTSIETIEKSPLAWFVDAMSGGSSGLAAGIGTIVHGVMEAASVDLDAPIDPEALWSKVEESWHDLAFESGWIEERERRRARRVVAGLSRYLREFRESGAELVSAESGFTLQIGPAVVRGKIDRVERRPDGGLEIVDLKTGRNLPTRAALAEHAQLGSYQLAHLEGALGDLVGSAPATAGAKLVFVATGAGDDGFRELIQEPLDDEGIERFRDRIRVAARSIVGPVFLGRLDLAERDPKAAWPYRIQLVPGVSA